MRNRLNKSKKVLGGIISFIKSGLFGEYYHNLKISTRCLNSVYLIEFQSIPVPERRRRRVPKRSDFSSTIGPDVGVDSESQEKVRVNPKPDFSQRRLLH